VKASFASAARVSLGICFALTAVGCSRNILSSPEETANRTLFHKAALELPIAIAECKKEHAPLGLNDLDESIPADQNAASQYEKVFAELDKLPPTLSRALFAPDREFDPAKTEIALKDGAGVISDLRKAVAYPHCYFKPTEPEFIVPFRTTSSLKKAATIIGLDARLQASKGNVAAAAMDMTSIFKIEKQMEEESAVVTDLVAVDIQKSATLILEEIMEACKANPSVAEALWKVVNDSMPNLPTGPPFRVEILPHYSNVPTYWNRKNLDANNPALYRILDCTEGVSPNDIVAAFQTRALQFGLALFHAADDQSKTGEQKLEEFQEIGNEEDSGDGTHCWMSFIGADFEEALSTIIKYSELRDCSLIGLKIMKDHKLGSPWPKSLPSGGPKEELTGKPFNYKSSATGFEVYAARIKKLPSNGVEVSFRYPANYLVASSKKQF
jgi:hypothetical protein